MFSLISSMLWVEYSKFYHGYTALFKIFISVLPGWCSYSSMFLFRDDNRCGAACLLDLQLEVGYSLICSKMNGKTFNVDKTVFFFILQSDNFCPVGFIWATEKFLLPTIDEKVFLWWSTIVETNWGNLLNWVKLCVLDKWHSNRQKNFFADT